MPQSPRTKILAIQPSFSRFSGPSRRTRSVPASRVLLALAFLLAFAIVVTPAAASSSPVEIRQVTETEGIGGDVGTFAVSPDGQRIVYLADQDELHGHEVFSAPQGGGAVERLSPPLDEGYSRAEEFRLSPPGDRVVIEMRVADSSSEFQLFSAPIDGGPPVLLTATLSVSEWAVSPVGDRVVFRTRATVPGVGVELFSVPITGGTPTRLHAPLSSGRLVGSHWRLVPDGSGVVFLANRDGETDVDLFTAPLTGAGETRLVDLAGGETVTYADLEVSADAQRAVFEAGPSLYSVPLAGGAVSEVSGGDQAVVADTWEISYESSRVLYLAAENGGSAAEHLFSAPIGGGVPARLSRDPVAGGGVDSWRVDPSSGRVFYRADEEVNDRFELYATSLTGGPVTKVNGPLLSGSVEAWAVGSGHVVWEASQEQAEVADLYSRPVAGGPMVRLSAAFSDWQSVWNLKIRGQLAYAHLFRAQGAVYELFSFPLAGGSVHAVNAPLLDGGFVGRFEVPGDGSTVFYTGHGEVYGVYDLYQIPAAGGNAVRLSAPIEAVSGFVRSTEIGESAGRLVLVADLERNDRTDVFTTPIDGGEILRLSDPQVHGSVSFATLTPDGESVVYAAFSDGFVSSLYTVPIDGGTITPIDSRLTWVPDLDGWLKFTAGGERVVFLSDRANIAYEFELVSAPLDGGPAGTLNVPGRYLRFPGIFDVAGTNVLYLASAAQGDPQDLFHVAAGGGPSTQLDGPEITQDIGGLRVDPSMPRVIFEAGRHLYAVPFTGGPNLRLSQSLVDERRYGFDPSSQYVVYISFGGALYRVPAGGGNAVQLTPPMPTGGGASHFLFSADGQRIVYEADQEVVGKPELFSVPLLGGPSTKLNIPLPDDRGIFGAWLVSPAEPFIVYEARPGDDGTALYYASLDGSDKRLLAPQPADRHARPLALSDSGSTVIYGVRKAYDHYEVFSISARGSAEPVAMSSVIMDSGLLDISTAADRVAFRNQVETGATELFLASKVLLFCDDFESGGLDAWSVVVGDRLLALASDQTSAQSTPLGAPASSRHLAWAPFPSSREIISRREAGAPRARF